MTSKNRKITVDNLYNGFTITKQDIMQLGLSCKSLESLLSIILNNYLYPMNYSKQTGISLTDKEYFLISSIELQSCTPRYNDYLKFLEEHKIIIRGKSYEVGKRPKSMMLTDNFKRWAIIHVEFVGLSKFPELKFRPPTESIHKIDKSVLEHLTDDYKNYLQVPENLFPEKQITGYKEPIYNDEGNIIGGDVELCKFRKYIKDIIRLKEIKTKNFFMKWSSIQEDLDFYDDWTNIFSPEDRLNRKQEHGRCYSNFTQLPSEYRNQLLLDGERIIDCDIKNSFPMFLSLWLIDNGILNNELTEEEKEFLVSAKIGKFYTGSIYTNGLKQLFDNHRNMNISTFPWNKDKPMAEWTERGYYSKDEVKEIFAQWINGNGCDHKFVDFIFETYYPNITNLINEYKTSKEIFFIILSRMESNFIFNTLIKRLYDEVPNLKLVTCHDGIYFPEQFDLIVHTIWAEEITKLLNLIPFDEDITEAENNEMIEVVHGNIVNKRKYNMAKETWKEEIATMDEWFI